MQALFAGSIRVRTFVARRDRARADRRRRGLRGADALRLDRWAMLRLGDGLLWRASLIAVVLQVCLYYRRPLRPPHAARSPRAVRAPDAGARRGVAHARASLYYWLPDLIIGRGVFVIAAVLDRLRSSPAGASRSSGCRSRSDRASGCCSSAPSAAAVELARELFERRHELGVEIVGFVDPDPGARRRAAHQPRRHRHDRRHPGDRPRPRRVDRVVVSLADARGKLPMDKLLEMKLTTACSSTTSPRSTRSTPARSPSRTCVRAG